MEEFLQKKKICNICGKEKSIDDFHKTIRRKDGLHPECKKCRKEERRKLYLKNREKSWRQTKDWRAKNPEQSREISRKYWGKSEKRRNKKKISNKKWLEKNPNWSKNYLKNKRKDDIEFKLISNLRNRIRIKLKKFNIKKEKSTIEYLGCTIKEFIFYLLNRFKDTYSSELSLESFQKNNKLYVIDHIIPCEAFNLRYDSAIRKCFHYSNMQILTKEDNDNKSDFLIDGRRARNLKTEEKYK